MNKKNIAELAGWYGAVAVLLAYILVSFKAISASGYLYQLLNFTGAIGIVIISLTKKVKQSVTVNVIWAIIAFAAIISLLTQK